MQTRQCESKFDGDFGKAVRCVSKALIASEMRSAKMPLSLPAVGAEDVVLCSFCKIS